MAPKVPASKAIEKAPPAASRSQHVPSPPSQKFAQTPAFSPFSAVLGNRDMVSLLNSGQIQAKLRVSQPGDPDELEADRVASQVMSTSFSGAKSPRPILPIFPPSAPALHRKCACSGGTKCARYEEEEVEAGKGIHRKASTTFKDTGGAPESLIPSLGIGQSLDGELRTSMESRFGRDFGQVRIHTDSQAASAASSVNARAFTCGKDVVFNQGEYTPNSPGGQQLLAHELTHVVQQGAAVPLTKRGTGDPKPAAGTASESPRPSIQRMSSPAIMRSQLLNSTMEICHRVLKSKTNLHITDGGLVVKATAGWTPSERWVGNPNQPRPECGNPVYDIQLSKPGMIWDTNLASCEFPHGKDVTRQWTNIPEGDYFLTISTNNTNPNCCLRGTIEASQERGLKGASCTGGPGPDYANMPLSQKLLTAFEHSLDKMGPELGARIKELLTPESIALMLVFATAYVVSQTTPIGWVADILVAALIAATVLMVGKEVIDIVKLIIEFFDVASNAKSDADMDRAGQLMATALTKAGVDIVVAILFHKAGKAANLKPPGPRSPGLVEVLKQGGGKVVTTLTTPPAFAEVVTAGGSVPLPPEEVPGVFMMEGEGAGGAGKGTGRGGAGKSATGGTEATPPADKPLPGKKTAAAEGLSKNLPKLRERETPTEQPKKETGAQQERRLLREDRSAAGGRPAKSATYHAFEGGTRGSFRSWVSQLKAHIESTLKDSPNKPQINEAPLGENTAKFIDRHPNLKSTWEKLNLRIDTELKKIQTQKSAAAGDKVRIQELQRMETALEKQRAELTDFESGDAGNKRPDLVEVFFDRQHAVVTDITQKTGDPVHNFKTAFYVELIKEVLGWNDVDGVNFNTVQDQNITP